MKQQTFKELAFDLANRVGTMENDLNIMSSAMVTLKKIVHTVDDEVTRRKLEQIIAFVESGTSIEF